MTHGQHPGMKCMVGHRTSKQGGRTLGGRTLTPPQTDGTLHRHLRPHRPAKMTDPCHPHRRHQGDKGRSSSASRGPMEAGRRISRRERQPRLWPPLSPSRSTPEIAEEGPEEAAKSSALSRDSDDVELIQSDQEKDNQPEAKAGPPHREQPSSGSQAPELFSHSSYVSIWRLSRGPQPLRQSPSCL